MISKINYYVPQSLSIFENDKQRDFCVIIPVINEGQRIHDVLFRMQEINMASIADVIIVDGGSNDGSIEEIMTRYEWLNAVLQKNDEGKLSSQLLIGYHFAKIRNYKGVITIDGNNKDNPCEIPTMIAKLEQGYDFVQSSRFMSGGKHVNTPISRLIAIRLIHAPLLSMSSSFKWTDTTQGFRAYSLKLINNEKLNIFRACFKEYELLAYITHRAPSLGLRCIEIPGERVYPKKGKTPTKIVGFGALVKLLSVLLLTCFGYYNQKESDKKLKS